MGFAGCGHCVGLCGDGCNASATKGRTLNIRPMQQLWGRQFSSDYNCWAGVMRFDVVPSTKAAFLALSNDSTRRTKPTKHEPLLKHSTR
jgi:hypothetical protein